MSAGAYNGNDLIGIEIGCTTIVKQGGAIIAVEQAPGIIFICYKKCFYFVLFNKSNFFFAGNKIRKFFNGSSSYTSNSFNTFQLFFGRLQYVPGCSKNLHERFSVHITNMGYAGKSNAIE